MKHISIKSLRIILASIFLVLILTTVYNLVSSSVYNPTRKPLEIKLPIKKSDSIIPNMKKLKTIAMDSLCDNDILTIENIAKIDSMYPDSLCNCF